MKNNIDFPEGWTMPDDLAKRFSELMNKKSYGPEDNLQEALDDLAQDNALIESNPLG